MLDACLSTFPVVPSSSLFATEPYFSTMCLGMKWGQERGAVRERGGRGAWPQQEEVQGPQVGSPRAALIWPSRSGRVVSDCGCSGCPAEAPQGAARHTRAETGNDRCHFACLLLVLRLASGG